MPTPPRHLHAGDERMSPRPVSSARGAFSLVELLIVIAIVAVLVGVLAPSLSGARESARMSACASNARQLVIALDAYATDHADRYAPGAPESLTNLTRWHGSRPSASSAFTPSGGTLSLYLASADDAALSASSLVRACPTFAPIARRLGEARVGFERSAGGYGYNNAFVGVDRSLTGADPATGRSVWSIRTDRLGAARHRFERPGGAIAFADAALADGNPVAGVIEYSFVEPRFWPEAPSARADPSTHFRHLAGAGGAASVAWLDAHVSAARMTFSWGSGVYPALPRDHGLGWTGETDDNALFEPR